MAYRNGGRAVLMFPVIRDQRWLFPAACAKRGVENGRKYQDRLAHARLQVALMLRTAAETFDGNVAARLRRGLNAEQGPNGVSAMARKACFSPRQFHRLTVRMTGETPGAHQRRLRLDRAAWRLLSSRTTILEIAFESNWESHETFTRAFRARFGLTPSAFRKSQGKTLPRSLRAGFSIAQHTSYAEENI